VDPNLVTAVETLFLMAAWRISGYYGVDRWLLPRLGTPWTGSLTRQKTATSVVRPEVA
jgi:thiosulfate dehydrogenase [quinone] large subunit